MKKVLFVGAEVMPFAATGGLGDVLGSLPSALVELGGDIRVIMPLHSAINSEWREQMETEGTYSVKLAGREHSCGIKSLRRRGVLYYFVENDYYFGREALYGYHDDSERYALFCMAVMEFIEHAGFYPDIIHAHDWQAAMCLVYYKIIYQAKNKYANIKTMFTIHNIEYQGRFECSEAGDALLFSDEQSEILKHNGYINLMKAGIVCADMVSTVSPRYAKEIMTPERGRGLEDILNLLPLDVIGILNGIDYDYYNPETDKALAKNYTYLNVSEKYANKAMLQKKLGLPQEDLPLLSVISRLASHKGLDLICEIAEELIENNNLQFVVLGQGDKYFESFFSHMQRKYPDKVRGIIAYDRPLSRQIYAATDIFLMPSLSEPCGLAQMIASRYGAIPVVRESGGLYDSIKNYYESDGELYGNGFTFIDYSSDALYNRIKAAIALWHNKEKRFAFIEKIMRTDFSWNASAKKYLRKYNELS